VYAQLTAQAQDAGRGLCKGEWSRKYSLLSYNFVSESAQNDRPPITLCLKNNPSPFAAGYSLTGDYNIFLAECWLKTITFHPI